MKHVSMIEVQYQMNKIIYQGIQYNLAPFIKKHPGGAAVLQQYLAVKSDITECFKSTHSKVAEQKLMSLEVVGKVERSKFQKIYCKIEDMVRRHYSPSYFNEVMLFLVIVALFAYSLWTTHVLAVIASTAVTQVLASWASHSQMHSRLNFLLKLGKLTGGSILGLSWSWWRQKHERHHFFTNHDKLDEDIDHNYSILLAPLMLLKWRIQSAYWSVRHFQLVQMVLIAAHYFAIFKTRSLPPFIIGLAFASLYLAVVTQGNHEREKRYRSVQPSDFLIQQLQSTCDYDYNGWIWSWFLGGFNFHTQHHLFPQVPFYQLPRVHRILVEQLQNYKKSIQTNSILL